MSKNKYENALERIKKNVEPADNWTDEDREHYRTVVKALEIMCLITASNPQETEPWMEAVAEIREGDRL